ncbi:hypothetical protein MmazTMA_15350 [Methanosarcina mazei]|nr:hypothetical protein MmazTMA_15350 [Methanosarcina mazei]
MVNPIRPLKKKKKKVETSAKTNDNVEGIGFSKKRMPICNGLDRGSNFASIRKDADLLFRYFLVKTDVNP